MDIYHKTCVIYLFFCLHYVLAVFVFFLFTVYSNFGRLAT